MRTLVCILFTALLISCSSQKTETEKRYDMKGEVMKLDATTQVATIKHEKIGDWMDAMTMEFTVKPKPEFDKLTVGAQITGTVVVRGMDYHLTDVKVAAKAAGVAQ